MSERKAICPLCEATCGLKITTSDGRVESIRGNSDDSFSQGYLCPKGYALRGCAALRECCSERRAG